MIRLAKTEILRAMRERYIPCRLHHPPEFYGDLLLMGGHGADENIPLEVLSRWDRFASSYDVFLGSRRQPNFAMLARETNRGQCSAVAHVTGALYEFVGSIQQRALASDPLFTELQGQLTNLARAGVLISESEILDSLCRCATKGDPTAKLSLAIATRDRADSLALCLASYAANARAFGRDVNIRIVDDTPVEKVNEKNRERVRAISRESGIRTAYAAKDEKDRFCALLCAAGIPSDTVRFALFGLPDHATYGANRNALLLDCIGEMCLMVDDDTVCRPVIHAPEAGLSVTEDAAAQLWFFKNRMDAISAFPEAQLDVLGAHLNVLGRNLPDLIAEFSKCSGVTLDQVCHHMLDSLLNATGRIVATTNGSLGKSGMYSPAGVLLGSDVGTRQRIMRSKEKYALATHSGELLRVVQRSTISHSMALMATFLGLDNRTLLPPFMPVGRNEEGVFQSVIAKCLPDSYVAHLPFALLHAGNGPGNYCCDYIASATHIRVSDVMMACIGSIEVDAGGSRSDVIMRELGQHLIQLGSLSLSEFDSQIRFRLRESFADETVRWEKVLALFNERPDFWAVDVRTYLKLREQTIEKQEGIIPSELSASGNWGDALSATQTLITRFGSLLFWWPEIIQVAKDLQARESPLCKPI